MSDQLATIADLAAAMQTSVEDLDSDQADLALTLATAEVQAAVGGQRILSTTSSVVLPAPWDYWLHLPQWPVRSVSSVAIDGTTVTDWYLRGQRLYRAVGWAETTNPPSQVAVTYAHGYADTDYGYQLARRCVIALAKQQLINPDGLQSVAIDDYRATYGAAGTRGGMPETMRAALTAQYGAGAFLAGPGR